jgi:hypothetical protein
MTATVGWGRDGWNTGAWGTSPDAIAVITGISSSTSVGNVFASAPSLTIISGQVLTVHLVMELLQEFLFLKLLLVKKLHHQLTVYLLEKVEKFLLLDFHN